MADVLILGGTGFLGHEIARQAVEAGHRVTCLARGESGGVPPGARLIVADRTHRSSYDDVGAYEWDEVVEISYERQFVGDALAALGARARHWTLVSSLSVYARNDESGADESAELMSGPGEDYGRLKVAAEAASAAALGDRLLIARLGLIVGPGDRSDRFGYWPSRFALAGGGPVLVPHADDRMAQVIDVSDAAAWLVRAGDTGVTGALNVTGREHPLSEVLQLAAEVAGHTGELVRAEDAWLTEHGVNFWAGPKSLPLWLPASDAGFSQRDVAAFLAAGGDPRPLRDTIERTLTDERERGLDRPRRSGLTRDEELELIALLAAN